MAHNYLLTETSIYLSKYLFLVFKMIIGYSKKKKGFTRKIKSGYDFLEIQISYRVYKAQW